MNFDDIKQTDSTGVYWFASDLMPLFGYTKPDYFGDLLDRALSMCEDSVEKHFDGIPPDIENYTIRILKKIKVSRHGGLLLSKYADDRKLETINARAYFGTTSKSKEVVEAKQLAQVNKSHSLIDSLKVRTVPQDCPVVVSFGGGRNSTAMLILCKKFEIKVDLILFADTGGELPETYKFIQEFNKWLFKNKMPQITVVRRKEMQVSPTRKSLTAAKKNLQCVLHLASKINVSRLLPWLTWWVKVAGTQYTSLEESCLTTQALPSVAYGRKNCSKQWKVDPQDEFVNNWQPAKEAWRNGKQVVRLVGIHAGEVARLLTKSGQLDPDKLENSKYFYGYPLIEHALVDSYCEAIIQNEKLPIPPKSSCFFCPNRKLHEIEALPPDLRMRAHLIEQNALRGIHTREDSSVKGLGRAFAWSELADKNSLARTVADMQSSRNCSCMD